MNLADYYKNKEKYDARALARYYANKKEYQANNAKWHQENKERRAAYLKSYHAKNKERLREYRKNRHANDKPRFNQQSKQWRKKNPEKVISLRHKRRARIAGQGGQYSPEDIARIKLAQRNKCAICRIGLKSKFHRDHIVPISRGGTNDARNIQLTCGSCNSAKHSKDPIDFMQELGFLL